ncbi:MAG: ferritin-like domain-containing protein, partial [Byssovorax sp.]
ETLAAVVASAQHAAATDPAVREVLAIVAEEESRHAELAFRVVAWAVSLGGDEVRSAVHGAFLEALGAARHAAEEAQHEAPPSALVRAHGRLSTAEVLAERLRAAEEVVVPGMMHLLGAPA